MGDSPIAEAFAVHCFAGSAEDASDLVVSHALLRGGGSAVLCNLFSFEYHAGTTKRPVVWMQRAWLEWLHRFYSEPRRLARRYLITNSEFLARVVFNVAKGRK